MIPGVGLFYSGLARRKSALELLLLSMLSVAVVGFQWFCWGYSLTFSRTGNAFLGDMSMIGLKDVIAQPNGADVLPDILFCLYQGMFASITPALAIGAVADRGRVLPALVFIFIWSTVVYDPIAYWTWNGNGWLFNLGSLDFAGGGPVHIASGTCALAYSLMLGRRTGYSKNAGMPWRPHNVTNVVIGTVFLWVGWFGFNGGSALGMNIRAIMACYNTQLAACMAALSWILLDYRLEKKWSTIGFCSGAISGLVAITPAAGFVTPWGALIIGIVGGVCCNFATKLKFLIGVDEARYLCRPRRWRHCRQHLDWCLCCFLDCQARWCRVGSPWLDRATLGADGLPVGWHSGRLRLVLRPHLPHPVPPQPCAWPQPACFPRGGGAWHGRLPAR